MIKRLE